MIDFIRNQIYEDLNTYIVDSIPNVGLIVSKRLGISI